MDSLSSNLSADLKYATEYEVILIKSWKYFANGSDHLFMWI